MSKGYLIFWYYLLLIVLALLPFALGELLPYVGVSIPAELNFILESPLVVMLLLFVLLLSFNPFMFAWYKAGPRFFIPPPPASTSLGGSASRILPKSQVVPPEQTPQWQEIKKKNEELEVRTRELQAKDLELTLANKRLQELEQAKSDFIAVSTHQLRTPLAAIKWTLHMLLHDDANHLSEDQKRFLSASYDSVERIISTVNQLLNLDQIVEEEQEEFHLVMTDLVKLIDGVIGEFLAPAQARQVKLFFNKPNNRLPDIKLDPVKISMVMENLIDNAVKYSKPGGQIVVAINDDKVNSARNIVEIVVTDQGIGIPEAEQGKIFQRFYRAVNALRASPNGIGLGLFAAKDIITRHSGEIWFVSQENKGTEFHFTLPLRQSQGQV